MLRSKSSSCGKRGSKINAIATHNKEGDLLLHMTSQDFVNATQAYLAGKAIPNSRLWVFMVDAVFDWNPFLGSIAGVDASGNIGLLNGHTDSSSVLYRNHSGVKVPPITSFNFGRFWSPVHS